MAKVSPRLRPLPGHTPDPVELTSYQVRMSPSAPGATASYKLYVILTTDNERGSNAVAVTRPL